MEGASHNERTVVIKDHSLRQFDGGFTAVPNRILENSDLSLGARMTYAMLLRYAWQKDFCFPAQQQLAADLGITDRSVRTFLGELRELELIAWKQMGLNRPNVYYILKLPARTPAIGQSGPEKFSAPDRKPRAGQDRKPASDKEHSRSKTHMIVNDVTDNDPTKRTRSGRRPTARVLSRPALRSTYGLNDLQMDRVGRLVDRQAEILGAVERNHAAYVERAAEAVRDGQADLLEYVLGDFKQAATKVAVGSRPGYFHAMYKSALDEDHERGQTLRQPVSQLRHEPPISDDSRSRLIVDAERRGFPVPDHVRGADIATVTRWWADLSDAGRH